MESETLTGEIKITADNCEEKSIQNITNTIEQSAIKASLRYAYPEQVILYEGCGVPYVMSVKNISDQELQDVIVEMPIADGLEFSEDDLYIEGDEPYKFLGCQDRILKFKIPKIATQETIKISENLKFGAERVDLSKTEEIISLYFRVYHQEIEYVSK